MPSLSLDNIGPDSGFIVDGLTEGDAFGASVSDIGDFNGDGFDDIAVGSPGAGSDAGVVYILFGRDSATPINFDLATLDATEGVRIEGAAAGDQAGRDVASAGDLNNDGFEDLVIGAPTADGGAGRAYVVFGSATPAGDVALANLDGADGFEIKGDVDSTNFGYSVTSAGDFNGDGLADFAIGASGTNSAANGSDRLYGPEDGVFLLFGGSFGASPLLDFEQLDATQGVKFTNNASFGTGQGMGYALDGGVDFDGDGFDDLLIAQRGLEKSTFSFAYNFGLSFIAYGTGTLDAKSIDFDIDGQVKTNRFSVDDGTIGGFGHGVAFLGDINGDGFEEIALGAPGYSTKYSGGGNVTPYTSNRTIGLTRIYSQSTTRAELTQDLLGPDLFGAGATIGDEIAGIGDINGDGFADALVSATSHSAAVLLLGGNGPANVDIRLTGSSRSFATALDGGGDFNGDGIVDLIVGNPRPGFSEPGRLYVLFGSTTLFSAAPDPAPATAGNDVISGSVFDDILNGLDGDDVLTGLAGGDSLTGGAGDDVLDGGGGSDTVDYSDDGGSGAVSVNLETGIATDTHGDTDTLTSIENVIGATGNGILIGNSSDNRLDGRGGFNSLTGGAGADIFISNSVCVVDYSKETGPNSILVDLSTRTGIDTFGDTDFLIGVKNIIGTSGDDQIIGDFSSNSFDGGAGDDILIGGSGFDTLTGGDGVDTVDYGAESGGGAINVDLGVGSAVDTHGATDTLIDIEIILGSGAADTLNGQGVDSSLFGRGGDDRLIGGQGVDVLNGGAGRDRVDYSRETGANAVSANLQTGVATDTFGDSDSLGLGLITSMR